MAFQGQTWFEFPRATAEPVEGCPSPSPDAPSQSNRSRSGCLAHHVPAKLGLVHARAPFDSDPVRSCADEKISAGLTPSAAAILRMFVRLGLRVPRSMPLM